jgi:hypothetical protein
MRRKLDLLSQPFQIGAIVVDMVAAMVLLLPS